MNYLGQLVPTTYTDPNKESILISIQNAISTNKSNLSKTIELYVTSKNALKTEAANSAVAQFMQSVLQSPEYKVNVTGIEVPSGVDEQPCGDETTMKGALNRLRNMKDEMEKSGISCETNPNTIRVLVSLENGIIMEHVLNMKNPDTFEVEAGRAWVDRCFAITEIWIGGPPKEMELCSTFVGGPNGSNRSVMGHKWTLLGISEGVTTPKEAVRLSIQSGFKDTAGKHIGEIYKWNPKDWHGSIAGKGRLVIMKELLSSIFTSNSPHHAVPVPAKTSTFKPDVYHQYETEQMDLFVPKDIVEMMKNEKKNANSNNMEVDVEIWRSVYNDIPQLNKPGADGVNPSNSIGVILTEDIVVGYFDEVNNQDTLHIILVWSSSSSDQGSERISATPGWSETL